jgi:hypothetical protein
MSDYDNGFARAQRAYDMQSDDSDSEEPLEGDLDQEMMDNQHEDIDDIERLFIAAKLIIIDEMGGLQ